MLAAVREIAGDFGVSPAQVALAWTTVRSTAVRPIAGPRTVDELDDNLAALDLTLPDDAVRRLEAATDFAVGFPGDFIAEVEPAVFGETTERVVGAHPRRSHATTFD